MKNRKQIIYKTDAAVSPEDVSSVFKMSGIKRPSDDLPRLQRMIDHADVIITAWVDDKLVGIARAITDFSYCCYLSDLAVHKEYQNMGIGRELVRLLHEHVGEEVALLLLSSPIAMEYYPHIGFEKIENGYRIPRMR
ncbi:GNAT family N-acetyltransferase [Metabacillus arenae]|uniref:GNAT family N-acetyltransferase n=1 Tax=Metabacillus arenae TaxID=2771434 RepID=A0A926NHA2_9BACI|nr:GNAT family N-acetyltransferase [Metabacillus arenae]MBD1383444.1 GNAT family N-acetyltransferase [Metabacillus arenae]